MDDLEEVSDPEEELKPAEQDKPKILLGPLIADRRRLGLTVPALVEQVKEAIAAGSDVNDASRNNHRPLNLSIRKGYTEVARLLIESGADIHYRDRGGLDPIHLAINHSEFKIANLLIKKGARFSKTLPDSKYDYAKHYQFMLSHYGKGV